MIGCMLSGGHPELGNLVITLLDMINLAYACVCLGYCRLLTKV